MKTEDIQNVIGLLKLAKLGEYEKGEKEEGELTKLKATPFSLPVKLDETLPLISIDGSYCFLFSFLGAETWIVMFRIAVTEYCIENKNNKDIFNFTKENHITKVKKEIV